ncbi:hypothetical protein A3SI_20359, partial [Nitritalea halalkaliphila LW7]
ADGLADGVVIVAQARGTAAADPRGEQLSNEVRVNVNALRVANLEVLKTPAAHACWRVSRLPTRFEYAI